MGTRHLIGVISGGEYKIAQYGQWDGYIEGGQGERVLSFIRKSDLAIFKEKLDNCRFLSDEEIEKLYNDFEFATTDEVTKSEAFFEAFPSLSRDTGAGILDIVYESDTVVFLKDDQDFIDDRIFCEFAYIIDLDKHELRCYTDASNKFAECDLSAIPTAQELEAIYYNQQE